MRFVLGVLAALVTIPGCAAEQPQCPAAPLSDQQVKDIVSRARAADKNLPAPFPQYKSWVRREGCYYSYVEALVPAREHATYIFLLNPRGVLVDVQRGREFTGPGCLKCPDQVLTERELAKIVAKERAARKDLPPPFAKSRVSVTRVRCLYYYSEYADFPDVSGAYQLFRIDAFGGVVEAPRSHR